MPLREDVLAIVKGPLSGVFASFFDEGGAPKVNITISPALKTDLPAEPVYKWSQKVSAWLSDVGHSLTFHSENALWLDLTRLIANHTYSDQATCEIITNYSKVAHGHFEFNPSYGTYRMKHYTDWMFDKRLVEVVAARACGVPPAAISEYQDFIGDMLRGYSPVDIAIHREKNITAKALLQSIGEDMSVCLRLSEGELKKPCYLIKSLWLEDSVPVGDGGKIMFNIATKAAVDDGALKFHSKLGVAINAGNLEIAKFILGLGYLPDSYDCEDIKASFGPSKIVTFLNSLNEEIAADIVRPVLAAFHEVGVEPSIQVLGDSASGA